MQNNVSSSKFEKLLLFSDRYLGVDESSIFFVVNKLVDDFKELADTPKEGKSLNDYRFKDLTNLTKVLNYDLKFKELITYNYNNEDITLNSLGVVIGSSNKEYLNKNFRDIEELKDIASLINEDIKRNVFISRIYQIVEEKLLSSYGKNYAALFRVANHEILDYETKLKSLNKTKVVNYLSKKRSLR